MSDAEKDPVLRRAIDELRRLPDADPGKVKRVVLAAAAARVSPADDDVLIKPPRRSNAPRFAAAGGLIAAALIVGFVSRGAFPSPSPAVPAEHATPQVAGAASPSMRSASASSSDMVALPQQFTLRSAAAHRVSVVGDFNDWNPKIAPLVRSPDGVLWSTIVPVMPGRHLYGFMVDDSLFVLDPRAPKASDPDLGSEGSVVIVGRP
ncbi:MAG: glycogen-binding domain-containing protein [Gemmatimonadaceae bacterium]